MSFKSFALCPRDAQKMLQMGVSPTETLLHLAEHGEREFCAPHVVRDLVRRGADVNARHNGHSSLQWMAAFASPETLKILLDAGADVNAADDEGMTPLLKAAWGAQPDNLRILREAGADLKAVNKAGKDAVAYANDCPWQEQRAAMISAIGA